MNTSGPGSGGFSRGRLPSPREQSPTRNPTEPTVIQLSDMTDPTLPYAGPTRTAGESTPTMRSRAVASSHQPSELLDGIGSENITLDHPPTGHARSRVVEEPSLVEELLDLFPPETQAWLIAKGNIIKEKLPGFRFVGVRGDLKPREEDDANSPVMFNVPRLPVNMLTSGLKFHAVALTVSLILFLLTEVLLPSFFDYPYTGFSLAGAFDSWLLLLWGGILAGAVWYYKGAKASRMDNRTFLLKAANGLALAVLEEAGFRFLYIFTVMLGVTLFNKFISLLGFYVGLLSILLCVGLVCAIALIVNEVLDIQRTFPSLHTALKTRYNPLYIIIGCVVAIFLSLFLVLLSWIYVDIFNFVWDWLILPVLNFFSLWQFDDLFMGFFNDPQGIAGWTSGSSTRVSRQRRKRWKVTGEDNRTFIVAMVLSNLLFRDGGKYQGLVGWINSWYVGLALLSCMLKHGVWTALLLHLLYDLEFLIIGFVFRKFSLARGSSELAKPLL
ncbi:CPBP family intramembrane metalloprotease [Balamuthia mandrillaris]